MKNFKITICALQRVKANLNFDISYIKFGSVVLKLSAFEVKIHFAKSSKTRQNRGIKLSIF